MDDSVSEPSLDVNFYGSIVTGTATGDLLSSFTLLVDALDLVKSFFTSRYLTLPKDDFIKRVANEAEDDEDTLRYARNILFALTKRKRKFNLTATLIERKAGEGAVRKLLNDIYEIFSFCEGSRESLPKSMMRDKDIGQGHPVPELCETELVKLLGKSVNDSMQSSLEEVKRSVIDEVRDLQKELSAVRHDVVKSVSDLHLNIAQIEKARKNEVNNSTTTSPPEGKCQSTQSNTVEPIPISLEEKVCLFVGDSLFHALGSRRLMVDDIKAVKLAKSGDTVSGTCQRAIEYLKRNGTKVEGLMLLAGTNDLKKRL